MNSQLGKHDFWGLLLAAVMGIFTASAWTLWTVACNRGWPLLAGAADVALIAAGAIAVNYYTTRQYRKFAAYTIAAGAATAAAVWMGN